MGSKQQAPQEKRILTLQLLNACEGGHVDDVRELLKKGADLNFCDYGENGDTPLHCAVRSGVVDVMWALICRDDIQLSVENAKQKTPLDLAWDLRKESRKQYEKANSKAEAAKAEAKEAEAAKAGALKAAAALMYLKFGILEEAECIVDTHRKQSQERRDEEENVSFYEAVLNGKNNPTLSMEEIESILSFFCPVWVGGSEDVLISKTFQLVHNDERVSLRIKSEGGVFYSLGSSGNAVNAVQFEEEKSTSTTEALLKVKNASAYLNNNTTGRAKKPQTGNPTKELIEKGNIPVKNISKISIPQANNYFANVLDQIARTKSKMTSLEKLLEEEKTSIQKLLEGGEEDIMFNYESSNLLIFFLETFALQGIEPSVPLAEDVLKELIEDKKNYFSRFFPKTRFSAQDQLQTFGKMRSNFIKHSHYISPEHLDLFFQPQQIKMKDLIDFLLEFTMHVMSMHQESKELTEKSTDVFETILTNMKSFLAVNQNQAAPTSESLIKKFCKNVEKMLTSEPSEPTDDDKPTDDDAEKSVERESEEQKKIRKQTRDEIKFELIVNINSTLNNKIIKGTMKKPYICTLRNSFIHDFFEPGVKFKEDIARALHDYYRFELARNVHDILVTFREPNDQESLETNLDAALEAVDTNFQNIKFDSSEDLKSGSSEKSNGLQMELRQSARIYKYVRYMAPIFDVCSDDENYDDSQKIQSDLSDEEKWDIFEAILDQAENKKHEAPNILKKLPLSECQKKMLEGGNPLGVKGITIEVSQIMENLDSLHSTLAQKCEAFSHYDLITLFEAFTKNRGLFSFINHRHLLDHLELSQDDKKVIEDCLNSLPDAQSRREIGEPSVEVNLSSIVLSLLKLISSRDEESKVRINSISSAFADKTFIMYLVSHDIKKDSSGELSLEDEFRTCKVLKDVGRLGFTGPYVATLLTQVQCIRTIETDHLHTLLVSMVKGNIPSQNLKGLLMSIDQQKTRQLELQMQFCIDQLKTMLPELPLSIDQQETNLLELPVSIYQQETNLLELPMSKDEQKTKLIELQRQLCMDQQKTKQLELQMQFCIDKLKTKLIELPMSIDQQKTKQLELQMQFCIDQVKTKLLELPMSMDQQKTKQLELQMQFCIDQLKTTLLEFQMSTDQHKTNQLELQMQFCIDQLKTKLLELPMSIDQQETKLLELQMQFCIDQEKTKQLELQMQSCIDPLNTKLLELQKSTGKQKTKQLELPMSRDQQKTKQLELEMQFCIDQLKTKLLELQTIFCIDQLKTKLLELPMLIDQQKTKQLEHQMQFCIYVLKTKLLELQMSTDKQKTKQLELQMQFCIDQLKTKLLELPMSIDQQETKLLEASFTILRDENLSDECIQAFIRALCSAKVLGRTLKCVNKQLTDKYQGKPQGQRIKKNIFAAANVVCLEYINSDKLDLVETILSCEKDFTHSTFTQEYEELHLLKAKMHIRKGRKECDGETSSNPCKGEECFQRAIEALTIFESGEPSPSGRHMLALSRRAYAYFLLGTCKGDPDTVKKGDLCHATLWRLLWKYVSSIKEETKIPEFEQYYRRAMNSARYKALMTNAEYKKYLNVAQIKSESTRYLFFAHKNSKSSADIELICKDLQSWNEIYVTMSNDVELMSWSWRVDLQEFQAQAHFHLAKLYYHQDKYCFEYEYHWLKAIEFYMLRYNNVSSRFGPFSSPSKSAIALLNNALEDVQP